MLFLSVFLNGCTKEKIFTWNEDNELRYEAQIDENGICFTDKMSESKSWCLDRYETRLKKNLSELKSDLKLLEDYLGITKWEGLDMECLKKGVYNNTDSNNGVAILKEKCKKSEYTKDPDKIKWLEILERYKIVPNL